MMQFGFVLFFLCFCVWFTIFFVTSVLILDPGSCGNKRENFHLVVPNWLVPSGKEVGMHYVFELCACIDLQVSFEICICCTWYFVPGVCVAGTFLTGSSGRGNSMASHHGLGLGGLKYVS